MGAVLKPVVTGFCDRCEDIFIGSRTKETQVKSVDLVELVCC